jgi:oxygen-independent coproporphyrinogen III oxidase
MNCAPTEMSFPLKELLSKYNVPGPRYTSYPTVPAWTEDVTSADYQKSLQTLKKGETLSLYFHLPFCEQLCHFCGCMQVITKNHDRSAVYTEHLLKELKNILEYIPADARTVTQIHFGGGTPNFFKPDEMTVLMQAIRENFSVQANAEIAIEMHPRTSTAAFCDVLKKLGFNRVSLGVQDFDPEVQRLIHRGQSYEMTKRMLDYLRKLAFDSFNFDLIYGLPGQNQETWQETLKKTLELRPNRLAVYSYAHVPWVRPVQRSFDESDLPSPALKLELFEEAYETFIAHGYRLIGMDHFALADDELAQALERGTLHRNFMGYSTRADAHQIGFGVSAISFVGGHYFQNLKDLKHYYAHGGATGRSPLRATFRGCLLNRDDTIRRDLIMAIMCNGFVDCQAFEKRWDVKFSDYFSKELAALDQFVKDGLLEIKVRANGCSPLQLRVIGKGFLFLRNIAMCFDPYLREMQKKSETPIFSKTV